MANPDRFSKSVGVLCYLCFFSFDQLFDPPRAQQHDIRRGGEGEDINDQAPGEGNDGLHRRIDGQGAFKVRADEEHIEGFIPKDAAVKHHFVKKHGDANGRGEHGQGAQHGLVLCPHVARAVQIDGDGQHGAVADHGLDVDADLADEHVARIEHNAQPCKQSVGSKISHQAPVYLSFAENTGQEADVHGGGAELEGKSVPLEIPNQTVVLNIKAVNEHFEDFKQDDDDAGDEHGASDAGIVAFFVRDAKQNTCENRQGEKQKVKPAVVAGAGHRRFTDLLQFYPKIHGLILLFE